MSELHSWLSTQHHGLRTYKSLKQKLMGRASADPEHAALCIDDRSLHRFV
jgi:hypothetical protein